MALPFVFSSAGAGAYFGQAYTRFKGLILAGSWTGNSTALTGPLPDPSGIALIQPSQVVSTLGATVQVISTLPAAVAAANYVYISQTTGPIFTTSSTDVLVAAPPMTGMGAALLWDAGNKRFNVYSTVHGWVAQLSSVGGGYFSSS